MLAQKLSLLLNKAHRNIYNNSHLSTFVAIDCSVTCDDLQFLEQLENLDPNYYESRRIQKRKFREKLFTKKSVALLLNRIDDNTFLEFVKFPIDGNNCIKLSIKSISIRRNPIYFGGRYLKFSRKLPQSPWPNQGNEYYNTSIQELIFDPLSKYINSEVDQMTFSASGREDIDVRCLGNGRPFVIEVRNSKTARFSELQMKELQTFLNSSTNLIEILNLQMISKFELDKLKEGEEHKSKTYHVYCISEKPLESLKSLNEFINLETGWIEIEQKTPIRVLHRRSLDTRKKKIFELSAEFCPGSLNQFLLKVCSQAGTYIKEFVHSDFGRTNPSVSSILQSNISVAALDVVAINFDWLTNNIK